MFRCLVLVILCLIRFCVIVVMFLQVLWWFCFSVVWCQCGLYLLLSWMLVIIYILFFFSQVWFMLLEQFGVSEILKLLQLYSNVGLELLSFIVLLCIMKYGMWVLFLLVVKCCLIILFLVLKKVGMVFSVFGVWLILVSVSVVGVRQLVVVSYIVLLLLLFIVVMFSVLKVGVLMKWLVCQLLVFGVSIDRWFLMLFSMFSIRWFLVQVVLVSEVVVVGVNSILKLCLLVRKLFSLVVNSELDVQVLLFMVYGLCSFRVSYCLCRFFLVEFGVLILVSVLLLLCRQSLLLQNVSVWLIRLCLKFGVLLCIVVMYMFFGLFLYIVVVEVIGVLCFYSLVMCGQLEVVIVLVLKLVQMNMVL